MRILLLNYFSDKSVKKGGKISCQVCKTWYILCGFFVIIQWGALSFLILFRSRKMRQTRHVTRIRDTVNLHRISVVKLEEENSRET